MFTVQDATLKVLPDATLPQFDQLLINRLKQQDSQTQALDGQLLGRYASEQILLEAKAVYEAEVYEWDCKTADGFMMYFLRVEPSYGLVHAAHTPSFCLERSLPMVIGMNQWGKVEPGIIEQLNGSDPDRAQQAAETLAKYGTAKAEKALWSRLRSFAKQSAVLENELANAEASETEDLRSALVEALGKAQSWLLDDGEVTVLEGMTSGPEKEKVQQWHWRSPLRIDVYGVSGTDIHANIQQYMVHDIKSLTDKLAQYPAGTRFGYTAQSSAESFKSIRDAVGAIAAERGFIIAPLSNPWQ